MSRTATLWPAMHLEAREPLSAAKDWHVLSENYQTPTDDREFDIGRDLPGHRDINIDIDRDLDLGLSPGRSYIDQDSQYEGRLYGSSARRPRAFTTESTSRFLAPAFEPELPSDSLRHFQLQAKGVQSLTSTPTRSRSTRSRQDSSISFSRRGSLASPAKEAAQRRSFAPRETLSPRTERRSPPIRRAPASHSSHGIETVTGPPPALSTQRRERSPYTSQSSMEDYRDDEDSGVSTAPPSVWDELEEIKSRIRRLELTGRLPTASEKDRPQTSSTSPLQSNSGAGGESVVHSISEDNDKTITQMSTPSSLLNSALEKTKSHLPKEVCRALEATVEDIICLSAMLGTTPGNSAPSGTISASNSVVSGSGGHSSGVSARQVRRKTDSICRNMTELCVALNDNAMPSINAPPLSRPTSRDDTTITQLNASHVVEDTNRLGRTVSHEPDELNRSSTRVMSRLEARRSSMMVFGTSGTTRRSNASSDSHPATTPTRSTHLPPTPGGRINRSSTDLLRPHANDDASLDVNKSNDNTIRPLSRARTDVINHGHSSPRQRVSREYTSTHPLPESLPSTQNSPTIAAARLARRNNLVVNNFVNGSPSSPGQISHVSSNHSNHSDTHAHTQSQPLTGSPEKTATALPTRRSYDSPLNGMSHIATASNNHLGLNTNLATRRLKTINHTPRSPSHLVDRSNTNGNSTTTDSHAALGTAPTTSRFGLRYASSNIPSALPSRRIPRPSLNS